ncbi:iron chelate uptake ABC transporter family permease subunit [Streptomyces sp. ICBB 8177]|uniref:FecCD family ABC transporter permease n=1 Tax=Streptomyces sp. ICBB 8177 TaxID=563922 RepID=UPI001F544BB1|nr:iron chelate uptake ABC transporter family permease subunit [Streptomyces sp. ICBB 8177]
MWRRSTTGRALGLIACLGVLAVVLLLSLAIGAKSIPPHSAFDALFHFDGSDEELVVRQQRFPRTALGLEVGVALGLAGALMQALTRNPLADPGILGVNSGASAAVAVAVGFLGLNGTLSYVWFAFAGAALVSVVVYALGSAGRTAATPVRLALAGTAVTAALTAFTSAVLLLKPDAFDQFRYWNVGSVVGRDASVIWQVMPFVTVGAVLALGLGRSLNALALGEDSGRALGVRPGRTRALGALAVTLLCGAATAAVGPIGFVGLVVPHLARFLTGPDQRWVLPYSAVLAPALLVGSDVLGRVVARPGEVEVGIVTAFLGAPVFIALARGGRISQL